MKSYQEIVRTSSKRDPRNGRANPPIPSSSPFITSSPSLAATNGATSPRPNGNGHADRDIASEETNSISGTSEKRKGRFHGLARLQIGGLGRKDKGKGKASAENGKLAVAEEDAGTYDGSEGGRYLVPPPVGPNGAMMQPPPPPHAYPYAYPAPGRAPYPWPQAYPAPSTSVSSSAPVTTPATTTGASTSPTSPNTPTSAAHYYPYVATTSRLAAKRQNSNQMASPQSFRSRGSGADANGTNGVNGEEKEEMLDVLPVQGRNVSGSSMGGGRASLPPGAGPPAPSASYSRTPSVRLSPAQKRRGRASSVASAPAATRPPPPVPPFPYPPYPPYPPPPGAAAASGYPYPPYPPYPYPPYPPYPPYGYPTLPPPARTPAPGDPYGIQPPFRPSASQASFGTASTSRRLPPPPSNSLPPPVAYGPHPFSAPVHPSSSASASAVARNMAKSEGPPSQAKDAGATAGKGKAKEEEGKMSVGIDFGCVFKPFVFYSRAASTDTEEHAEQPSPASRTARRVSSRDRSGKSCHGRARTRPTAKSRRASCTSRIARTRRRRSSVGDSRRRMRR